MAEPPSLLDPFALWRELTVQLEKRANELANQGMQSDEFAKGMQKALGASLLTKKVTQELLKRFFEALNLPTRADTATLGERLHAIEDSLVKLSAAVDRLGGGKPQRHTGLHLASPPRTRKPAAPEPARASAPPPAQPAATRARTAARKSRKARV